jgi:hypothetical protein
MDLDPVDQRQQRLLERIAEKRAAQAVERMRHPDEATLLPHRRDRIGGRQAALDRALDEGRDQVTGFGPDLLADDDREAVRRRVPSAERPVDAVMVRDREVGDPSGCRRPDDLRRVGQRVERRRRVAVEVDEGATTRGCPPFDLRAGRHA